ncbi:MAG: hypothetical protein HC822_03940 [Oscillochloris sp.]|nr:hypothetical protein [Oscillochloris sp.]
MRVKSRLRLSLDHVWLFAAVAFIALRALLTPIPPHDFWWHMATGRLIATEGAIPTVDRFSYTQAGEPFYNQSWLAQLLMYGGYELGGAALLIAAQAVLLAFTYGLLLHLCIRRSGAIRLSAGFIMVATLPASFDNWIIRPQTYALPLFVIFLYVLTIWRTEARAEQPWYVRWRASGLWLLPLLAAIWVNLHGAFVLGGALIGLTFAGEAIERWWEARRERRSWANRPVGRAEDVLTREPIPQRAPLIDLIIVGVLTGAAWLLNPGGFQVIGYVRNLLSSSAVTQLVTEWAPPTIRDPNGMIFFGFLLAGMVILAYSRRRPELTVMLIMGAFLYLALGAVRNNIWFVAVATPLLVVQLTGWRAPDTPQRKPFQGVPMLNGLLIGLIGFSLLICLPWVKPALDLPPDVGALLSPSTPVAAVDALRADPDRPERLFHAMSYGSYLIWAAPEQAVWADPRIELYPLEQWLDYRRLSAGGDTEQLLEFYNIDGLLLSVEDQSALVEYARVHPEQWELRYEDETAVYFVHRQR